MNRIITIECCESCVYSASMIDRILGDKQKISCCKRWNAKIRPENYCDQWARFEYNIRLRKHSSYHGFYGNHESILTPRGWELLKGTDKLVRCK